MLFPVIHNKYSQNEPDIEIRTDGLISQLLDMILIKNHKSISSSINYALDSLHSQLSKGEKSINKEINNVLLSIKILEDLL